MSSRILEPITLANNATLRFFPNKEPEINDPKNFDYFFLKRI